MTTSDLGAARAAREATRVDDAQARSWQLVNALRTEEFDKAHLGKSDQIILDMEDAVDDSLKHVARENVVGWLKGGGSAWVRINDTTTSHWLDDMNALRGLPRENLRGVMLAKAEQAHDVSSTFDALAGEVRVIALVESALGIEQAVDIARARGTYRLAFGSGDYRKDTGTANEPHAMAYPRTKLTLASRIGGLTGPIDGPTVGKAHAPLREQSDTAVELGMTGKLCLDHEQPAIINERFSPSPADVEWARTFLAEFEAAGGKVRDGSDKPRLARADLIMKRNSYFAL